MRKLLSWALAAAFALSLASPAAMAASEEERALRNLDGVDKAPGVTTEMCVASHWLKDGSDELLMSPDEIAAFNRKLFEVEGTHTRDLSEFDGTFDGAALAEERASFKSPEGLYLNGEPVPESYYEAIRENIRAPR